MSEEERAQNGAGSQEKEEERVQALRVWYRSAESLYRTPETNITPYVNCM